MGFGGCNFSHQNIWANGGGGGRILGRYFIHTQLLVMIHILYTQKWAGGC